MTGMLQAVRGLADGIGRLSKRTVGGLLALLTMVVCLQAYATSAQAQAYSYSGVLDGVTHAGVAYQDSPGASLFGSSSTTGDEVSYFAFTIPNGQGYSTASLSFSYTLHSGAAPLVVFSALTGQPPVSATGISDIRGGAILASKTLASGNDSVALSASVVTQMNAIAQSGGGTLYIGAYGPSGVNYFAEFNSITLSGEGDDPVVTGLSPTTGPGAGGTSVSISGRYFTGATSVVFGGTGATGITVVSDTLITATAPAGASTVNVRVATPGGLSAIAAANQYTYIPAPTVSSISPTAGPTGGGTTVIISGADFSGATAVTFGATAATGFTVNGPGQITATSPAGTGTVDIRVTTPGGTSATSAADQYTFVTAPTVTSVSPTAGPVGGGQTVTITGTGFAAAPGTGAVKFGANNATYTINSNTQITATSPFNSAGTYDITVTTPGGTSATSAADQYTYVVAPTVTAVSPTSGPTGGGTTVTITGTGFASAPGTGAVKFGATNATYTINSNTQITATSPANSAGTYDVTVTTPGGTSATSAADQFTYIPAPIVASISPTAGPTSGGTSVTITGANFTGVTAVTFGATAATGFTFVNATTITAASPAGSAGTVDIRITTGGGTSATSAADQFTYIGAPTVSSISPTAGPTGGGATVIITGTRLSGATAVTFGGTAATGFTVNSATQITATSPSGSAGTVDIRVTTTGGTSATSAADQYTYISAPTVTSVAPTAGPTAGGTTVTITGTGFAAAPGTGAVKFGATNATYTINSNTQITATSPANSAGTYDITVTTPGGTSATSAADQFTYVAPPVGSSQTYGSIVGYNDGANATTNIDLSLFLTGGGAPANYAVGSATTAQGGSVSVNSSGIATYTPPVGYRNANDSFTYTASNAGGTSAPATVTVTVGNPTITLSLPSNSATVERPYNVAATPVTASGGRASYTYNSASGLPAGLTMDGAGVISGTPSANGTFTVTVNLTDSSLGAGPFTVNIMTMLTVSLPPAPVVSSFAINGLTYNSGSATATTFSAAPHATESPSGYQVGASSYGATVSVDSAGLMSYTPPVGFRGTDTFNYVATNAGGTSNVGQVFVTVNDPTLAITLPSSTGVVGEVYNSGASVVTVTGGNAPYNNFSATGLPAGLTMDGSGVISGTPTTAANAMVQVTVTDSSGGNGSFTTTLSTPLAISAPNIDIQPQALSDGRIAEAYGQTLTTTGGLAPVTVAITAGSLPPGMSMTAGGLITGTPTGAGTYNFTVTATDASSYTGARAMSVTVLPPALTLSPSSLPNPSVAVAYSQTITAGGGTAGYTYQVTTGALPAGLTLANDGTLSGTPTVSGSYSFTLTATDSSTGTGAPFSTSNAYTMTLGAPTLSIAPATLPGATQEVAYNETLTASGGLAPYSYAVTSGALPNGLTLSTNGDLSGTSTVNGTFNFTVTVTDSTGGNGPATLDHAYSLVVAVPAPPTAGPVSLPVAANSGSGPVTLNLSGTTATGVRVGAAPSHGIATASGLSITYTPTAGFSGADSFTYIAFNDGGDSAPATVSITVAPPTLTLSALTATGQVTAPYSATVTASLGTAPYGFTVASGTVPTGLTLAAGGTLSGTPTAAGTFNFTVQAVDTYGATGTQAYTIDIAAPTMAITAPAAGALAEGVAYVPYSQTFTATGGQGAHVFSVVGGGLPAGLTLSSGGVLSGAATTPGDYSFAVRVTDSSSAPGPYGSPAVNYTLRIVAPAITITPAAGALTGGLITVPYSQAFSASGGTAPYGFAVTAGALPGGLTLAAGGTLSGTPTLAGSYGFTATATDANGFTQAAAYTLEIGTPIPVVQAKAAVVIGGQSVTIDATAGASGSPFTGVAVVSAPSHGTAVVSGMSIVYTANGPYSGQDSFTYTVSNAGGPSAPGTVNITVNPAVVAAPPKTATILAGQTAVVELTEGAMGKPFTGAAVVSLTPAGAGTATISARTGPAGQLYDLTFKPDNAFTGDAVVSYTLSNAFATSAPGKVTITVQPRPDPTQDPEVTGLISAQNETARRFATAQISNLNRRLERLHGQNGGTGFSSSLSLGGGGASGEGFGLDPSELRRMQQQEGWMFGGVRALGFDGDASSRRSEDRRTPGGETVSGPWGVWVSGAATLGKTDGAIAREGYKFTTDGLTAGADRRLGDQWVIGVAAGVAHDVSKIGDKGTRNEANGWNLALYGSYQPAEKAFFDLVLGYGKLDFDSQRYVTANGQFAHGQRDGDQWFGALTAGWDYRHPRGLHLSPYGRIEATRSTLDAFTEQGGGAYALAYDAQTTTTVTGAVGVRGDYAFKTTFGQAIPSFRLEYAYDLQGTGTARIRYADWLDGKSYQLDASPLDKNRMLYGLGLDLMRKSGMRLGLDYEGMLSGDQTSQTLRFMLETPF